MTFLIHSCNQRRFQRSLTHQHQFQNIGTAKILVFPVKADFTDDDDPAVANAGGAGAFMRVRVNYDHEFFTTLIGGFFGGGTVQISSEGTFRNENFIL